MFAQAYLVVVRTAEDGPRARLILHHRDYIDRTVLATHGLSTYRS